jgi:hypothetical protein
MAQHCYSKEQLWQPIRWGNVQHSLNMSSVCSKILRHVSMCIIALLQMISIAVIPSCIDSDELMLISHWPKGGSIPSFQGHCWKWCHFMYFSKLHNYFETWKYLQFQAFLGFQLLFASLLMLLEQGCVCLCVCMCMHMSVCNTLSVTVE